MIDKGRRASLASAAYACMQRGFHNYSFLSRVSFHKLMSHCTCPHIFKSMESSGVVVSLKEIGKTMRRKRGSASILGCISLKRVGNPGHFFEMEVCGELGLFHPNAKLSVLLCKLSTYILSRGQSCPRRVSGCAIAICGKQFISFGLQLNSWFSSGELDTLRSEKKYFSGKYCSSGGGNSEDFRSIRKRRVTTP